MKESESLLTMSTDHDVLSSVKLHSTVLLVAPSRARLGEMLLDEFEHGGVFAAGRFEAPVGEKIILDLAVASELFGLQILGVVKWKRTRRQGSLKEGIGIALPEAVMAFLKSIAHDSDTEVQKRSRRIYASLPAQVEIERQFRACSVSNISRTGVYLDRPETIDIGNETTVRLYPNPRTQITLRASVVRCDSGGMGLHFVGGEKPELQKFRDLLFGIQQLSAQKPSKNYGH